MDKMIWITNVEPSTEQWWAVQEYGPSAQFGPVRAVYPFTAEQMAPMKGLYVTEGYAAKCVVMVRSLKDTLSRL